MRGYACHYNSSLKRHRRSVFNVSIKRGIEGRCVCGTVASAMFRIKKDGRKNDGKNDRTSKLIQ